MLSLRLIVVRMMIGKLCVARTRLIHDVATQHLLMVFLTLMSLDFCRKRHTPKTGLRTWREAARVVRVKMAMSS